MEKTKKIKIAYFISTGLLSLLMLMSAGMYLFKTADMQQVFEALGYPSYVVVPLALAKMLGLIAIWFINNRSLKEWAYAGFFFDFVLAFFAHLMVGDGEFPPAIVAILLLFTSYFSWKTLESNK